METPHERRIFKLAFVALFVCLLVQGWWLFRQPPAVDEVEHIDKDLAGAAVGTLNVFVKTDRVAHFVKELPVISNLGGGR